MKKRTKSWFKPKGYLHFSPRLSDGKKDYVEKYILNNIDKHSFFPLIHETISVRKYKALLGENGEIYRSHFNNEKKKPTKKDREIFYANHLDAQIYSYYSNEVLGKEYELLLKKHQLVNDAVIAYRRIPIDGIKDPNKCNIHFAKELFEEIEKRENCVAVCYDIENFFPTLNHDYLKKCWMELLNLKKMPKGDQRILNSLTKYSYVEISDIVKVCSQTEVGIQHKNDFRKSDLKSYFISAKDFRDKIAKKNLIKVNKPSKNQSTLKGIPQGTPISAFLANLYLFEFDYFICEELVKGLGCFYRRYSDDIVLLFNNMEEFKHYDSIIREKISLKPLSLTINPDKTIISQFSKGKDGIKCVTKTELTPDFIPNIPMRYLGFEFDGKNILIKSNSLSKFHRELKSSIRKKYNRAKIAKDYNRKHPDRKPKDTKLHLTKSYARFTHLGKSKARGNYFSYVERSAKEIYPDLKGQKNPINRQIGRAWNVFNTTRQRYENK